MVVRGKQCSSTFTVSALKERLRKLQCLRHRIPSGHDTGAQANRHAANLASATALFSRNLAERPFEPQQHLARRRRQWFEGWFVRVIDHANHLSIALIIGSMRLPTNSSAPSAAAAATARFDEHIIILAYRDADGRQEEHVALLGAEQVELHGGGGGAETRMDWWSALHGGMRSHGDRAELSVRFGATELHANVSGPRVAWNSARPDTDGPEGWLASTGLLPCHYFVHSFASPTSYALHRPRLGTSAGTAATAHLERNYGAAFPLAWVWAQAIAAEGAASLVATGGLFQIGPITTMTYVLGLRAPAMGISWDFRTTDLDRVVDAREACAGRLAIKATSADGRRRLELKWSAPSQTFGAPLYVPTAAGFSNSPGCRESYNASVEVQAWQRQVPGLGRWRELPPRLRIPMAALEFGGTFQCGVPA